MFLSQVLNKAKLEARTQIEFVCSSGESDPRGWIKKTFDDLNLARIDTVSIPRRIRLNVDSGLLTTHMNRIADVVDTKGVDAAQFNREDLDRYIREDDTALCILTEGFDTAPTNVIPLLQRHITRENPLSQSKFILMVIPKGSDPEKVVGSQGPVEERKSGIELRRSQIEETFASQGLPSMEERLIFFDPLRYFEFVGLDYRRRTDSEPAEIEADREEVWTAISHANTMRVDQVWKRVGQIAEKFLVRSGRERGLIRQRKTLFFKQSRKSQSIGISPLLMRIAS